MEFTKGMIVISKAGRDKGDWQVIMDCDGNFVTVCDGRYRPLENMKRKNIRHVQKTNHVVDLSELSTNNSIKKILSLYNSKGE